MLGRHNISAKSFTNSPLKSDVTRVKKAAIWSVRVGGYGVLLGGFLSLAAAVPADAQRADHVPDQIRRIQTVEPLSGPAGTTVNVHTANLPLSAQTHVGVGAQHVGFEVLLKVNQSELGEVAGTLQIPAWATWDRPVVLLILNGKFAPIGRSDPFQVTNPDGMIQRTGQITNIDGSCVDFRDQDDFLYSLEGSPGDLEPGDGVIIEGAPSKAVGCGPGIAIRVERVVPSTRVAFKSGDRR